jgi:hypothetical protein
MPKAKQQTKRPADNKKQQLKKALLEALEKSLGVVTTACKSVGCDRTVFYRYYKEDAEFKDAVDSIDDIALDFAESQLHKQIAGGNPVSTIFFLKTRGKKRGYVEKSEVDVNVNSFAQLSKEAQSEDK